MFWIAIVAGTFSFSIGRIIFTKTVPFFLIKEKEAFSIFARACFVIFLYIVFITCGIGIARSTREPYGRLVVIGLVTMFATQIMVNIGMTLGIAPIVGITLPFISYGGSSMVTSFVALSIIFNIKMRSKIDFAFMK